MSRIDEQPQDPSSGAGASSLNNASGFMQIGTSSWLTLGLLTLANILLSLDRTIMSLLTEPVKHEFNLSDTQLGILLGVGFSLPLGIAGVVLGPLIDRVRRKRFLALVLSIWSGFTFLTGFANSFLHLAFARAGLGASEAPANPAAMSMIGDLFPPSRRSTAIGVFKVGTPMGMLVASVLVGYVAANHGWRAGFFVAGIPGFILSIAVLLFALEPERGGAEIRPDRQEAKTPQPPSSYFGAFIFMVKSPEILFLSVATMLVIFAGAGLTGFIASFLQREYALSLSQVGMVWGIGSTLGLISPIAVGLFADRQASRSEGRIQYLVAILCAAIGICAASVPLMPTAPMAIVTFLLFQFLILGFMTPCATVLIGLTPPHMRGAVISLTLVINMGVGRGLGPSVIGGVSDLLGGEGSLGSALVIVESTSFLIATLALVASAYFGSRPRRSERAGA